MRKVELTRDLVTAGYGYEELHRSADFVRIRRGAYVRPHGGDVDARTAHLELIEATTRLCGPGATVSHMSAAAVHGLPIWTDALDRVHLTRDRPGRGQSRRWVAVHGVPLTEAETVVRGKVVTSLARTVLDLACSQPLTRSVAIGDAALRAGLDQHRLAFAIRRARGRDGIRRARRCVKLLDRRSESVGESQSRLVFVEQGVPTPVLQYEVRDRHGHVAARSDFAWPEFRTLGEFDGRIKYGRQLRPDQDIEEVLFDEKLREDTMRSLDWQVVRWTTPDLWRPGPLVSRLNQAFERGRRWQTRAAS